MWMAPANILKLRSVEKGWYSALEVGRTNSFSLQKCRALRNVNGASCGRDLASTSWISLLYKRRRITSMSEWLSASQDRHSFKKFMFINSDASIIIDGDTVACDLMENVKSQKHYRETWNVSHADKTACSRCLTLRSVNMIYKSPWFQTITIPQIVWQTKDTTQCVQLRGWVSA
jgi:hypothetical protein